MSIASLSRRLRFALAIGCLGAVLSTAVAQDPPPPPPPPGVVDAVPVGIMRNEQGGPVTSPFYPKQVPIAVIIQTIQEETGATILLRGTRASTLQVLLTGENLTVEQALTMLAEANQLEWRKVAEGQYELWDKQSWDEQVLPTMVQRKVFIPQEITGADFEKAIKGAGILTEKVGSVGVDERTNQVIVTDLPEVLAVVQDLLALIDQPQVTRVFYIRYAKPTKVEGRIKEYASPAGRMEVDEKQHLIIVTDILNNIRRMESLIEILDNRPSRRVYNLNSIGSGDDDLEALQEALGETLLSEDAYFMIDEIRGLLFVEDIPENQRDVEEFLRLFNAPPPQVLIQAELIEVSQTSMLSYGTNYQISADLASAVADGLVSNFAAGSVVDQPFGFIDYKEEFPIASIGSGGLSIRHLGSTVKAELTAALSDTETRVLLRPRLLVKNREEAVINVGTQEPVATVQSYGSTTDSDRTGIGTQMVTAGLEFKVEPTITRNGLIEMKLDISNSDGERVELAVNTGNVQSITGIRKREDSASTVLIVPDGETMVVSGLIRHTNTEAVTGVPILVNIPWLGPLLFGNRTNDDSARNLMFFITPTIVRTGADLPVVAYDFDADSQDGSRVVWSSDEALDEPLPLDDLGSMDWERYEAPLPDPALRLEDVLAPTTATMGAEVVPVDEVEDSAEGLLRIIEQSGGTPPATLESSRETTVLRRPVEMPPLPPAVFLAPTEAMDTLNEGFLTDSPSTATTTLELGEGAIPVGDTPPAEAPAPEPPAPEAPSE